MSSAAHVRQALERSYRQARYLASLAHARWFTDRRQIFEQISVTRAWDYNSHLERERHERVLARVKGFRGHDWGCALELGSYDGIFTERLASRCRKVLACDISPDACARTSHRCASLPHVRTMQLNIEADEIPGTYDLVFAMDILNYIYGRDRMLKVSAKVAAALIDNGLLVITDARLAPFIRQAWFHYWVPTGADNITRFFARRPEWRLLSSEFHPDSGQDIDPHYMAHVIAIFEKRAASRRIR